MKNLRKAVHALLKTKATRVYFTENKVPKKATFPYIVYDLQVRPDGEGGSLITLDINGWDNISDTTRLEDLMEQIEKLDKHVINNDDQCVVFYLESKQPVPDNDEGLNRRLYMFTGKMY